MYTGNYIDPNYRGPMIIQGFLKKLKSEGSFSKFLTKFNKRFFILDLNNYFFGYQDNKTSSNFLRHELIELISVNPNPNITETCEWRFAFVVEISKRIYTLYTHTKSLHKDWTDGLKACIRPNDKAKLNIDQQKIVLTAMNVEKKDSKKEFIDEIGSLNDWKDKNLIFRNNNCEEDITDIDFHVKNRVIFEINNKVRLEHNQRFGFDKELEQSPVENRVSYSGSPKGHRVRLTPDQKLQDKPKLFMIKGDFKDECDKFEVKQKIKHENTDEEDEVSLVYSPKFAKKQNDDFGAGIPILITRPYSSREHNIEKHKPEVSKNNKELENSFKDTPKEMPDNSKNIQPISNGILDLMADFDSLGLEKIEIRPALYLKRKSLQGTFTKTTKASTKIINPSLSPKKLVKSYRQTPENITKLAQKSYENQRPAIQVALKKTKSPIIQKNHLKTMDENNWDEDSKANTKRNQKTITLGNITVKPIKKKIMAKFVEKPEIVPDDGFADKKKPKTVRRTQTDMKNVKRQMVSDEKKYDKGHEHDCNWDEWDD